jgi:hypothetical protein
MKALLYEAKKKRIIIKNLKEGREDLIKDVEISMAIKQKMLLNNKKLK